MPKKINQYIPLGQSLDTNCKRFLAGRVQGLRSKINKLAPFKLFKVFPQKLSGMERKIIFDMINNNIIKKTRLRPPELTQLRLVSLIKRKKKPKLFR